MHYHSIDHKGTNEMSARNFLKSSFVTSYIIIHWRRLKNDNQLFPQQLSGRINGFLHMRVTVTFAILPAKDGIFEKSRHDTT